MKRKAAKKHFCDTCHRPIKKGDFYISEKLYFPEDGKLYTWNFKTCLICEHGSAKKLYQAGRHIERAKKRANNCPDADFQYVWQGGWDSALGCADGGDVRLECHKCNLRCIKGESA